MYWNAHCYTSLECFVRSINVSYEGCHDPYMLLWNASSGKACNSIRPGATKICGASAPPQSMFVPCISNPFWSTVALVPPWLDVTEWGVLGHTRATKGRNLGCFAEIDPRIDSHSWASLVWMEECWTTVCDFGTKLVYRLAQHGPCTCRQWWWWWRAVIKAQLLEAWLELEIILYPFCQGFKHSKCGVLSTFNSPQKSHMTTWDRIINFWNDIHFICMIWI